jgi:NhaA family Na+:H+ antiporter
MPPAAATWAFVHASGIHATVAGVLFAFTAPVRSRPGGDNHGDHDLGPVGHFDHRLRPTSTIAVPISSLLSAGVTIDGLTGLADTLTSRVAVGITARMVIG